jgi:hypothetical protein
VGNLAVVCTNLFEDGISALGAGTASGNYPFARLFDRSIGRRFWASSIGDVDARTTFIGPRAADRVILPADHNATSLAVRSSDDGVAWTPRLSSSPTPGTQYVGAFASVSAKYWSVVLNGGTGVRVYTSELFLGPTVEFDRAPSRPGSFATALNVDNLVTGAGGDRFFVNGPGKRQRVYSYPNVSAAHRAAVEGLLEAWAGHRPFYVRDAEGVWFFAKIADPVRLAEVAAGRYSYGLTLLEVLP